MPRFFNLRDNKGPLLVWQLTDEIIHARNLYSSDTVTTHLSRCLSISLHSAEIRAQMDRAIELGNETVDFSVRLVESQPLPLQQTSDSNTTDTINKLKQKSDSLQRQVERSKAALLELQQKLDSQLDENNRIQSSVRSEKAILEARLAAAEKREQALLQKLAEHQASATKHFKEKQKLEQQLTDCRRDAAERGQNSDPVERVLVPRDWGG